MIEERGFSEVFRGGEGVFCRAWMFAELGYKVFAADVYGVGAPAEANWRLMMYGGAVHSFTQKSAGDDITKGAAYGAKADSRSWEDMCNFLSEIFGAP